MSGLKTIKYMDRKQGQSLLAASERYPRDWLMMAMQLDLGCRSGELRQLRVMDVDLDSGFVFIGRNQLERAKAKTGERTSLIGVIFPTMRKDIQLHIDSHNLDQKDLLFFDSYHKRERTDPLGLEWHNAMINGYAESANLQNVYQVVKVSRGKWGSELLPIAQQWHFITSHIFRHTHIVWSILGYTARGKSVDITVIQQQVGHRRLETTAAYTRIIPAHLKVGYGIA